MRTSRRILVSGRVDPKNLAIFGLYLEAMKTPRTTVSSLMDRLFEWAAVMILSSRIIPEPSQDAVEEYIEKLKSGHERPTRDEWKQNYNSTKGD